ncbi:MAG: hypothetical protein JWM98_1157 [Thermoleophilia bacterium]|nr:hypothetical protein [Thermoleophilia bacterium]
MHRPGRGPCYPVPMAAKKARKRAYIPPSSEVVNRRERTETTRTQRGSTARPPRGAARGGRGGADFVYPEPSWGRTLKRLPIYFVMIFALQYLLGGEAAKDMDTQKRLIYALGSAAFVTVLFAPFMHMMDRFAYNRSLKRTGQAPAPRPSRAKRRPDDEDVVEGHVVGED